MEQQQIWLEVGQEIDSEVSCVSCCICLAFIEGFESEGQRNFICAFVKRLRVHSPLHVLFLCRGVWGHRRGMKTGQSSWVDGESAQICSQVVAFKLWVRYGKMWLIEVCWILGQWGLWDRTSLKVKIKSLSRSCHADRELYKYFVKLKLLFSLFILLPYFLLPDSLTVLELVFYNISAQPSKYWNYNSVSSYPASICQA